MAARRIVMLRKACYCVAPCLLFMLRRTCNYAAQGLHLCCTGMCVCYAGHALHVQYRACKYGAQNRHPTIVSQKKCNHKARKQTRIDTAQIDTNRHRQTRIDTNRHGQTRFCIKNRHEQTPQNRPGAKKIDTSTKQTRINTNRHEQTRIDTTWQKHDENKWSVYQRLSASISVYLMSNLIKFQKMDSDRHAENSLVNS